MQSISNPCNSSKYPEGFTHPRLRNTGFEGWGLRTGGGVSCNVRFCEARWDSEYSDRVLHKHKLHLIDLNTIAAHSTWLSTASLSGRRFTKASFEPASNQGLYMYIYSIFFASQLNQQEANEAELVARMASTTYSGSRRQSGQIPSRVWWFPRP